MDAIITTRPIIVFAKSSDERDSLRNAVSQIGTTVLCFENEAICFDNLVSIDPPLILVRTDSKAVAWRFIFALDTLGVNSQLLFLSNSVKADGFQLPGWGGVFHWLPSPEAFKALNTIIGHIFNGGTLSRGTRRHGYLVGTSQGIKKINAILPSLVQTSDPVLIEGEAGTGKELLARMIAYHASSDSIFIKIDCEALVSRKSGGHSISGNGFSGEILKIFELDSVTNKPIVVLLDKIDRLDQKAQAEVLLLWEKDSGVSSRRRADLPADLRFLATSEQGLARMVESNLFRKELFYRLNVIPVHMPPLRERKEDIPLLMDHFALKACSELKRSFLLPTTHISEKFGAYHWPGNVEELRGAMDRLAASGDENRILKLSGLQKLKQNPRQHLFQVLDTDIINDSLEIQNCLEVMGKISLKSISDKFIYRTEKKLLRKALESTNWNRKKAAALLNISYKSMLNKMKMYEIV